MFLNITAGQKFGGCGDSIGCSDQALECNQKDKNWSGDKTGLIGTCIPESGYFSLIVFGSGNFRKGKIKYTTASTTFIPVQYPVISKKFIATFDLIIAYNLINYYVILYQMVNYMDFYSFIW